MDTTLDVAGEGSNGTPSSEPIFQPSPIGGRPRPLLTCDRFPGRKLTASEWAALTTLKPKTIATSARCQSTARSADGTNYKFSFMPGYKPAPTHLRTGNAKRQFIVDGDSSKPLTGRQVAELIGCLDSRVHNAVAKGHKVNGHVVERVGIKRGKQTALRSSAKGDTPKKTTSDRGAAASQGMSAPLAADRLSMIEIARIVGAITSSAESEIASILEWFSDTRRRHNELLGVLAGASTVSIRSGNLVVIPKEGK